MDAKMMFTLTLTWSSVSQGWALLFKISPAEGSSFWVDQLQEVEHQGGSTLVFLNYGIAIHFNPR